MAIGSEAEESIFLTEIDGKIITGKGREVLNTARSAGLGHVVYGIHYIKPVEGEARIEVDVYSQTYGVDEHGRPKRERKSWQLEDRFRVPPYVAKCIVELISKSCEPEHK